MLCQTKRNRALYHTRSLSYLARKVPTLKKEVILMAPTICNVRSAKLWRHCILGLMLSAYSRLESYELDNETSPTTY
jgi:hypothetical protein